MRVGAITKERAELRLHTEIQRIDLDLARRANPHPLFRDCAARYLAQSRDKNSIETIRIHVGLLMRHLGTLEPHQIHDATLAPFIAARLADCARATTINRSLEVVRTILNRSARSYRDDDRLPWLNTLPPMITMLPESRRQPYPITWEEQDDLFPRLPVHLQRMALFAVDTGLRDSNVCGLRWNWEVAGARGRSKCVRDSLRRFQVKAYARRDPQRRSVVDHPDSTRPECGVGVSASRAANRNDEQQRLAACAS